MDEYIIAKEFQRKGNEKRKSKKRNSEKRR